jgi:hypothetical protein
MLTIHRRARVPEYGQVLRREPRGRPARRLECGPGMGPNRPGRAGAG